MDKILRIRTLADRFLAAETSLQEERELTELCRNGDLPADLLPVREMLLALESMALTDEERAAAAEEQPSGGQQGHVKVMTPVARGRRWLAAAAGSWRIRPVAPTAGRVCGLYLWKTVHRPHCCDARNAPKHDRHGRERCRRGGATE